jgi:hypothetical protein
MRDLHNATSFQLTANTVVVFFQTSRINFLEKNWAFVLPAHKFEKMTSSVSTNLRRKA